MTHDELLAKINTKKDWVHNWPLHIVFQDIFLEHHNALRAVVELHTGSGISNRCVVCASGTKCETIQVIEKELK